MELGLGRVGPKAGSLLTFTNYPEERIDARTSREMECNYLLSFKFFPSSIFPPHSRTKGPPSMPVSHIQNDLCLESTTRKGPELLSLPEVPSGS